MCKFIGAYIHACMHAHVDTCTHTCTQVWRHITGPNRQHAHSGSAREKATPSGQSVQTRAAAARRCTDALQWTRADLRCTNDTHADVKYTHAARRWTDALGSPSPELVAEWLAAAVDAAQEAEAALNGVTPHEDAPAADMRGRGVMAAAARERERQRRIAGAREEVLSRGLYTWFRAMLQSYAAAVQPSSGSPAAVFQRLLLAVSPISGLGAASLSPADVHTLLTVIARHMGVRPKAPGARIALANWKEDEKPSSYVGTVAVPLGVPHTAVQRAPTTAAHVGKRAVLAARHLVALGWRCLHLTRAFGPQATLWGPWHPDFTRPPSGVPTYALRGYYSGKFREWNRRAGAGGTGSGLWEWLGIEWEAMFASEQEAAQRNKLPPKRYVSEPRTEIWVRGMSVENVSRTHAALLPQPDQVPAGFDARGERWTCLLRLPMLPGAAGWPELQGLDLYLVLGEGSRKQSLRSGGREGGGWGCLALRRIRSLTRYNSTKGWAHGPARVALSETGNGASDNVSSMLESNRSAGALNSDWGGAGDGGAGGDLWEAVLDCGPDDCFMQAALEAAKQLLGPSVSVTHTDLLFYIKGVMAQEAQAWAGDTETGLSEQTGPGGLESARLGSGRNSSAMTGPELAVTCP